MSHSWPFPPSPWRFSWSSGVLVSPYVNLSVFRSWAERTKRSRGRACFCLWASLCGIMTTSPPLFSHFDHLSWSCSMILRQKSSTNHPGQIWCLSQNCEGAVKIIEAKQLFLAQFSHFPLCLAQLKPRLLPGRQPGAFIKGAPKLFFSICHLFHPSTTAA